MSKCKSGVEWGCENVAIPSTTFPEEERFCSLHQEELDKIKTELEESAWSHNVRNKEEAIVKVCATDECGNRPVYGTGLCVECLGDD